MSVNQQQLISFKTRYDTMISPLNLKIVVLTLLVMLGYNKVWSCSMYKLTANGKTMVGNNEDSWGRDASIWFEQGSKDQFGVVCVGYKRKQPHPDGAMNTCGLAFDAFTMPHKSNIPAKDSTKKDFAYADIKIIMQQCQTVEDVYNFLKDLNLHVLNGSVLFNGGMLFFADKGGNYLVVEASKMTMGKEDKFALANFSICDTKDLSTIHKARYRKGIEFLNNKKLDVSLPFCTALSDTMCENRAKVGDGTLYTNICDLNEGLVHLYFFHDYSRCVTFNLNEELTKGNHTYSLNELFPNNTKFQQFLDYKTPQNSKPIFLFLVVCGLLFSFSGVYFLFSYFRGFTALNYLKFKIGVLSLTLSFYSFLLLRNEGIFYFPSPYDFHNASILGVFSYMPFVLLLAMIPLLISLVKVVQLKKCKNFETGLFASNILAYAIYIGLFVYWKLFDVFG
jgi:hypothetical protein